jgi:predicted SnoaL-like aldol condensation-catalyzing enzyme
MVGDYVINHHILVLKGGAQERKIVGVEILKFSNGKIVEHWNASVTVPEQPANNNGVFRKKSYCYRKEVF